MKKPIIIWLLAITATISVYFIWPKKKEVYPKYVYNSCSNKWAIMTGIGRSDHGEFHSFPDIERFIGSNKDTLYLGPKLIINVIIKSGSSSDGTFTFVDTGTFIDTTYVDTINNCPLGREFQFNNEGEARAVYDLFQVKLEELNKEALKQKHIDDSVRAIGLAERARKDSIWRCNHSYKVVK